MQKLYSLLGLFVLVAIAPVQAQAPLCSTLFVTGACGVVQCEQARSCVSGVVNSWAGGRCNIARAAEAQDQIANECAACNQICASPTAWMQGTWSGSAHQPGGDPSNWDIRLTVRGSSYFVSYPTLGCSGSWSLQASDTGVASFIETISSGQDKCVGTVQVTVGRLGPTRMQVRFAWSEGTANATLTRD